jgi:hypothetical protein
MEDDSRGNRAASLHGGTRRANSVRGGCHQVRVLNSALARFNTLGSEDVVILDKYLAGLGLLEFTPVTQPNYLTKLRYIPDQSLTLRSILSGVPRPFYATFYHRPSVYSRSREIQRHEAQKTLRLFLASAVFAVPTFIIGVVGMLLLPESHPFRQWCKKIGWWGGVSHSVLLLWILATFVQFGIARYLSTLALSTPTDLLSESSLFMDGNLCASVAAGPQSFDSAT